jgi:hypothetical protein
MNPYWPDYQALRGGDRNFADSAAMALVFRARLNSLVKHLTARRTLGDIRGLLWRLRSQKRGFPHAHLLLWTDFNTQDVDAVDSVITVRYPKDASFVKDEDKLGDFRILIEQFQKHHHSARGRITDGRCQYGYPHPRAPRTTIWNLRFCSARDADGAAIVPHNPLLLSYFRSHHCLV